MQTTDFMGLLYKMQGMDYYDGIKYSILCLAVYNGIQLVYSFLNSKVCDVIGMKWTMITGNVIMTVCLLCFQFVNTPSAYFVIIGALGFSQVIFNSIPPVIVSLVVPTEELGNNFGILNCFCVVGQQIANFGLGMLVDNLFSDDPFLVRLKICLSSIFGLLAVITSFWIIQPSLHDIGQYDQIPDESNTN